MIIDVHKPGVCKAAKAIPAPTKNTAGVELAREAEGATTAKPEALGPLVGDEAKHEHEHKHDRALEGGTTGDTCGTDTVSHESRTDGERTIESLPKGTRQRAWQGVVVTHRRKRALQCGSTSSRRHCESMRGPNQAQANQLPRETKVLWPHRSAPGRREGTRQNAGTVGW
jgi:hypothetical protein